MEPKSLGVLLAVVGLGLALMRMYVAADPKPRPRLARWSLTGAVVCFLLAGELMVCGFLPGRCAGLWRYGVGGAFVLLAALALLWLELRQRRRRRARISAVAIELRGYVDNLEELYREAKNDPSGNDFERAERAARRADRFLVDWKKDLLDYLDANIGPEAVSQIHSLGTTVPRSGAPGEHARTAYEAHREALEVLLARVEQGKVRLRDPPQSSGDVLPAVKSFVYPRKP